MTRHYLAAVLCDLAGQAARRAGLAGTARRLEVRAESETRRFVSGCLVDRG